MDDARTHRLERSVVGGAVVLLALVLAQGLRRPRMHGFGAAGSARAVTSAALAVGGAAVLVARLRPTRAWRASLGAPGLVRLPRVARGLDAPAARPNLLLTAFCFVSLPRHLTREFGDVQAPWRGPPGSPGWSSITDAKGPAGPRANLLVSAHTTRASEQA